MTSFLLAGASLLGAFGGMALLCFQSPNQRHRSRLPEQTPGVRLQFILVGVTLLVISLGSAIGGQGVSFGMVLWLCQAGLVGLAMICCLPYYSARIEQLSRIAAVTAPGLFVAGNYL